MPCEVTVADLRKVRPVGEDGFSLRKASELYCGPRIIARFQPQVWVFDNAMDIEGECGVDVTRKVLAREVSDIRAMQDDTYESDHLVDLAALGHDGPFEVNVEDAICRFFRVSELSEIDERMLQRERTRLGIVVAPSPEAT